MYGFDTLAIIISFIIGILFVDKILKFNNISLFGDQ